MSNENCNPANDLTQALTDAAMGPKAVTGDSGSVTQQSLPDLIAAARFQASNNALKSKRLGFRRVQLRPGGNADLDFGR